MCKLAVEHQIRYTKRVDLPTDVAVQVVSLVLGGVVYPWLLNAKCGHHFQKNLPKYFEVSFLNQARWSRRPLLVINTVVHNEKNKN